jgi:hypothetical protein
LEKGQKNFFWQNFQKIGRKLIKFGLELDIIKLVKSIYANIGASPSDFENSFALILSAMAHIVPALAYIMQMLA